MAFICKSLVWIFRVICGDHHTQLRLVVNWLVCGCWGCGLAESFCWVGVHVCIRVTRPLMTTCWSWNLMFLFDELGSPEHDIKFFHGLLQVIETYMVTFDSSKLGLNDSSSPSTANIDHLPSAWSTPPSHWRPTCRSCSFILLVSFRIHHFELTNYLEHLGFHHSWGDF